MVARVLLLFGVASTANATCPTVADLSRGMEAELTGVGTYVYRSASDPARVTAVEIAPNDREVVTFAWGLFPLSVDALPAEPPGWLSLDYGVDPRSLPRPEPDASLTFDVTGSLGDLDRSGRLTVVSGPLSEAVVADCTYPAFEARMALSSSPGSAIGFTHLPTLGLAVPAWYALGGEGRTAVSVATFEALP